MPELRRLAAITLLVFLAIASWSTPLRAQTAAPSPAPGQAAAVDKPITTDDLQRLVGTLEDDAARQLFLDRLRALIAADQKEEAAPPAATLSEEVVGLVGDYARAGRRELDQLGNYVGGVPTYRAWLSRVLNDPGLRERGATLLFDLALMIGIPALVQLVAGRLVARPRAAIDARPSDTIVLRAPLVLGRAFLDLVPILAFALGAYLVTFLIEPQPVALGIGINLINAYLTSRIVLLVIRRLLAPRSPALRLLPVTDGTAAGLIGWARRFVNTAVIGYFVIAAAGLFGLPSGAEDGLLRLLGLLLVGIWIAFILAQRRRVAEWLREGGSPLLPSGRVGSRLRGMGARIWHLLAIIYAVFFYLVSAWSLQGGLLYLTRGTIGTALILVVASLIVGRTEEALRPRLETGVTPAQRYLGFRGRLSRFGHAGLLALRAAVVALGVIAVLELWSVPAIELLRQPPIAELIRIGLTILVVIALAVLAFEAASAAIERYLAETERQTVLSKRGMRARTLLPLLRKVLFVTFSVVATLIVLSEIGIEIAPLLAGAGVVGVAVGFGAQKLVQDVITGIFILVEDAIAIGDVVTVAGIGGQVEDMSIRSLRLRDLSGTVHTIPFSSVGTVSNLTRDFSYYVMDIGVAYREDTDEVGEVCTAIVDEMRRDPLYQADILEPLEVLGVDSFGDSAVIVKARIKTRPIKQWTIGREFNRRMKKRFDQLGIDMPFPHRTLYFGADKKGEAPPARLSLADPPERFTEFLKHAAE